MVVLESVICVVVVVGIITVVVEVVSECGGAVKVDNCDSSEVVVVVVVELVVLSEYGVEVMVVVC